jgi:hypothetical protein
MLLLGQAPRKGRCGISVHQRGPAIEHEVGQEVPGFVEGLYLGGVFLAESSVSPTVTITR